MKKVLITSFQFSKIRNIFFLFLPVSLYLNHSHDVKLNQCTHFFKINHLVISIYTSPIIQFFKKDLSIIAEVFLFDL